MLPKISKISNKKRILVLSPHLDDAVLSCCDHILKWKKEGHEVTVVTVFSKFITTAISEAGKENMTLSGFTDVADYEKQRKKEDKEAMKALGVKWKHLNFIDGGFRSYNDSPIYPQSGLFSGQISRHDKALTKKIQIQFKTFNDFGFICIPLGIGKHIDHLLIRQCSEETFQSSQLIYYADQPYTSLISNISIKNWWQIIKRNKTIRLKTERKKKILDFYESQISFIIKSSVNYIELLLQ